VRKSNSDFFLSNASTSEIRSIAKLFVLDGFLPDFHKTAYEEFRIGPA